MQIGLTDDIYKKLEDLAEKKGVSLSNAGRIVFERAELLNLFAVETFIKRRK